MPYCHSLTYLMQVLACFLMEDVLPQTGWVYTTHFYCLAVWTNVSWCPMGQRLHMHGHQSLPLPLSLPLAQ